MRKLMFLLAASSVPVLSSSQAFAAAFELREFSAGAQGTAYAGAAASSADPGDMFYNPAALGGVGDWDVSTNAAGILLDSKGSFNATTSAGTPVSGNSHPKDFIGSALLPSLAARYRLNDQWAVGVTVTAPYGETTNYPNDWVGRYYAQTTNLKTVNITPMVSWQVTSVLTLAAGAQIQYAHAMLSEAIDFGTLGALVGIPGSVPGGNDGSATLKGASWDYGYVVGAQWKPAGRVTLGVSYHSEIKQSLRGHESFTYDKVGIAQTINALTGSFANGGASAELPLPASVNAGARYDVTDQWAVLAGVEYTDWSTFRQLEALPTNPANPIDLTVNNWHGTWFGSLGAEYRPMQDWTFRVGTAYDNAAVPQGRLIPRIPDAQRYWLSAGIGYNYDAHTGINFAVSHLFTPSSTIAQDPLGEGNALRGTLNGTTSTDATLVSLELIYR